VNRKDRRRRDRLEREKLARGKQDVRSPPPEPLAASPAPARVQAVSRAVDSLPPGFKPWQPGQSGNPAGYSRGRRFTDGLLKLIDEKNADGAIASVWLQQILKADRHFFRYMLERAEGPLNGREPAADKPPPAPTDADPTDPIDDARFDWYAETCPCGLEPGECKEHPRARPSQRPPEGDWRVWAYVAGRGAGKTRAGAAWIQSRADSGLMTRGCLIAPTAADIRDVMVEGPSGLLAVAPPGNRPKFEVSKRRVTWPNGAQAICITGEEPERARGPNFDTIWADELACWQRPEQTWDLAMLALRYGQDPRALITTTPRRVAVLRRIVGEASTVRTTDTTYANEAHLHPQFMSTVLGLYEGTRLGRQEIYAEFLETTEGVWFGSFDPTKHITEAAEYDNRYPVRLAIDAGTSRHTAAVFFQVRPASSEFSWPRVTVFGEYHAVDVVSAANAKAIHLRGGSLPCAGRIDLVRLDPAANARSSLGPAAYGEYERVFGSRIIGRWPGHLVLDGLDTLEMLLDTGNLLIHPRCLKLKDAFLNYAKAKRAGQFVDYPADGHPEEDMMDSLRGGVRDAMPEGRPSATRIRSVSAGRIL
jgi:hypothetical protein